VSEPLCPWRDNDCFWYGDAEDFGDVGDIGPGTSRKRLAGFDDPLEATGVDEVREGTAVPLLPQDDVKAVRSDFFPGRLRLEVAHKEESSRESEKNNLFFSYLRSIFRAPPPDPLPVSGMLALNLKTLGSLRSPSKSLDKDARKPYLDANRCVKGF